MSAKSLITLILIISAFIMAGRIYQDNNNTQFKEGQFIHIDKMTIEFSGENATADIEYHLTPFGQGYIFLFGSRNLKAKINEIFSNFSEVKIQRIGYNDATLQITNISIKNGHVYLHNPTKLGLRSDLITIVYPYNQGTKSYKNLDSTIAVFYPSSPEYLNSTI
jgi:hypothetical protein